MRVDYKAGTKLELWVLDTGSLDGYTVFVSGQRHDVNITRAVATYTLARPDSSYPVVVHYGGGDGGETYVVDVTDPNAKKTVAFQPSAIRHSYEVLGV